MLDKRHNDDGAKPEKWGGEQRVESEKRRIERGLESDFSYLSNKLVKSLVELLKF